MSKAPRCKACDTPARGKNWEKYGQHYSRAECAALRSDALPYWLKPSDFAGEVRRALVRRAGRAWTVAESVALRKSRELLRSAARWEVYSRLLQAIDKGPPRTPAAMAAELAYHLKRWESHDGLSKADRGSWEVEA